LIKPWRQSQVNYRGAAHKHRRRRHTNKRRWKCISGWKR